MFELEVRRFRFLAEATSTVRLPPAAGAALRGALFSTLRSQYCLAARRRTVADPPWRASARSAGCWPRSKRAIRGARTCHGLTCCNSPGGAALTYAPPGLEFTLTVFGQATDAFPYALLGVQEMGQRGIGQGRQGSFG